MVVEGRLVFGLHQSLIRYADALTAVVAGGTCLHRYTGIVDIVYIDLHFSRRLDGMDKHMSILFFIDGRVVSFIESGVGVGDVT